VGATGPGKRGGAGRGSVPLLLPWARIRAHVLGCRRARGRVRRLLRALRPVIHAELRSPAS
jgi:hypothetical protein